MLKLAGLRNHQRQSPLVEVKVAEIASEATYRETLRVLTPTEEKEKQFII